MAPTAGATRFAAPGSEWAPFTAGVGRVKNRPVQAGLAACLAADRPATFRRIRQRQARHARRFSTSSFSFLQLYIWLLIAAAVLSWLVAFNVVNTRNQFVAMVGEFLYRITEPVLRPIRNMMPNLGGIDISPVILILIIILIERRHRPLHLSQRHLSRDAAAAVDRRAGGLVRHGAADAQGRARRHRRHRDSCADGRAC